MATPASGAISLNNMRSEIMRTSSGSISMSTIRTMMQGGTGSISFNSCRGAKGFPNEPLGYIASNKVGPETDGFSLVSGSGNTYYQIQSGVDSYLGTLKNIPATSTNGQMWFTFANGTTGSTSTWSENTLTKVIYNGTSSTGIYHDTYQYFNISGDGYVYATNVTMGNSGTCNVVLVFSG